MRKITSIILLVACLSVGALAQEASPERAAELAGRLSSTQELPTNVRLRFQVLGNQINQLVGKGDPSNLLRFFSDTRVMIWSRPVKPATEQTMRSLEQQMVALAGDRGVNLDLPPVGYAPLAGPRLISPERVTAPGLSNLVLQTEQVATELLQANSSADLLFFRDNLTRLREDLADGAVETNSVRSVLGSRVRYLAGDAPSTADQRLVQRMDQLAEVLRGNFPPEVLRQNRGQVLTL